MMPPDTHTHTHTHNNLHPPLTHKTIPLSSVSVCLMFRFVSRCLEIVLVVGYVTDLLTCNCCHPTDQDACPAPETTRRYETTGYTRRNQHTNTIIIRFNNIHTHKKKKKKKKKTTTFTNRRHTQTTTHQTNAHGSN